MSNPAECRNGHDLAVLGRNKEGKCRQCRRAQDVRRKTSPARKAVHARYGTSPKGRASQARYRASPKGRARHARENMKRLEANLSKLMDQERDVDRQLVTHGFQLSTEELLHGTT